MRHKGIIICGLVLSLLIPSNACYAAVRPDYTGWAKTSSGERRYYSDGVRLKGVHLIGKTLCTFDSGGILISQRKYPAASIPYIIFDNDFCISREGKVIEFDMDLTHKSHKALAGADLSDFKIDPYFDLYGYRNGEWQQIFPPYETLLDDVALLVNEEGKAHLKLPFEFFDDPLESGIYRVRTHFFIDGSHDEYDTVCEFNIV
ncbi:MAG: hypothetical protein IJ149_09795 [Oscillospiraceae bacterium]|nr:hypothetical protein [Oscillospiraceae bacterium]